MSIPEDGQLYFLSTIFHPSGTENIIYARLPRLGCAVVHAVLQLGFMDTETSSWERNVQCETSNEWAKRPGGETSKKQNVYKPLRYQHRPTGIKLWWNVRGTTDSTMMHVRRRSRIRTSEACCTVRGVVVLLKYCF